MTFTELLFLFLLTAAFAVLVGYVRHDGFAAGRNAYRDELGVPRQAPRTE